MPPDEFYQSLLFWLTQVVMLVGLFGLIFPIFPGLFVIWLAALGTGVMQGFSTLGIVIFILISILAVAGMFGDNLLMGVGARQGGASWKTILLAFVAGILGTLFFPPFGGLVAAPLAVLLLEYYRYRDWKKARQALMGLLTGWGVSFVVRFIIGLMIIGLWWLWVFKG
jgi:uncharacterized protein YqgC (DUF456 family)